jgi:ABC-2 type transport system permease protein
MNNLIRAELFKMSKNKTFRILMMLLTAAGLVLTLVVWLDSKDVLTLRNVLGFLNLDPSFTSTGIEFFRLTFLDDSILLTLILSTFSGFYISNDYLTGVIKNEAISGNSRGQIFFAKLIAFSIGSIVMSVLFLVIPTLGATLIHGFGTAIDGSTVVYVGRTVGLFLLHLVAFVSIMTLIAIILQESAKTIIVSICFIIIVNLTFIFLARYFPIAETIFEYTVFAQISEASKAVMTYAESMKSILVAVVTFIVIAYCGSAVFQKIEIK